MDVADPLFLSKDQYRELRDLNRLWFANWFDSVVTHAYELWPDRFFERFAALVGEIPTWGDMGVAIDPSYSTTIRAWTRTIERLSDHVTNGVPASVFGRLANLDTLIADLHSEYPALMHRGSSPGKEATPRAIHGSIHLSPAESIASSPCLGHRVQQCLPDFPDPARYAPNTPCATMEIEDLIRHSLDQMLWIDAGAHESFAADEHTIFFAVERLRNSSLGTGADHPGTLIAGIRPSLYMNETLLGPDLYHEHCHSKLCLCWPTLKPGVADTEQYVSPFKHEIRDFEGVLHTIYPFTMECLMRYQFLQLLSGRTRELSFANIYGITARLEILLPVLDQKIALDDALSGLLLRLKAAFCCLNERVRHEADGLTAKLRDAHQRERRRIRHQHAADVGRHMSAGRSVSQAGLSDFDITPDRARLDLFGPRHDLPSGEDAIADGDFGHYIEAALA